MLIFLFASCISTIEIDTVPVNKILVVGSLISPDTVFWCNVSKVYAVNDSSNHYIDNATVKIFDNASNALVCEFNYDSAGVYPITVGVQNVYNRMNPYNVYYSTLDDGTIVLKKMTLFPIMPSVSYSYKF